MKPKVAIILFALLGSHSVCAQLLENFKVGIYGRTEQNIYKYYGGLGRGNFYTQRTSSGYSAGIAMHTSVNYLFNAGMSLGISEASYKPDFKYNSLNNTLWNLHLRLWQTNLWGELKFGQNEFNGFRLLVGFEWMSPQYKREIWQFENGEKQAWPSSRVMPRLGLTYEWKVNKNWVLEPNAGLRMALSNKTGFDYPANQFWFGASLLHKIKFR